MTAPLLDPEGKPAAEKADGDAESLDWNPATGAVTIGFEQDHRLVHYAGIDPARPATLARLRRFATGENGNVDLAGLDLQGGCVDQRLRTVAAHRRVVESRRFEPKTRGEESWHVSVTP